MKNFLLYLGNARAGSSWLHGELSKRSDCALPIQKELFIFQKWMPIPHGFDKEKYFDYISDLGDSNEVKLVGDITPSNAYATKEQYYWFKENMESRGFNVLPVMSLRDPISHAISLAKLQMSANAFLAQNNNDLSKMASFIATQMMRNTPGVDPRDATQLLEEVPPGFARIMIPWKQTVESVEEVFGKIHFNFYETFFNEQSVAKLCDYLEIPYKEMDYSRRVFSFGEHPNFPDNDRQELFDKYPFAKENYEFAVERFGKDFIESIWWTPYK